MRPPMTISCPCCKRKLTLYDMQVKQRKGYIRCIGCGARIPYDLDAPGRQHTGYWPKKEISFKYERD